MVTSCDAVDECAGRLLVDFRLCALRAECNVIGVGTFFGPISSQYVIRSVVRGVQKYNELCRN